MCHKMFSFLLLLLLLYSPKGEGRKKAEEENKLHFDVDDTKQLPSKQVCEFFIHRMFQIDKVCIIKWNTICAAGGRGFKNESGSLKM